MAEISATLVKTLRDRTGSGVIACKKALAETQGDLDAAVDRLRAAEISKAAEKIERVAAEGLVGLVVEGTKGAIVELNTETDFVARTQAFRSAAAAVASIALSMHGDHGRLLNAPAPDGDGCVAESDRAPGCENRRTHQFAAVRLRLGQPRRRRALRAQRRRARSRRIGVLVALESPGQADALLDIGHKIAMHVAASSPLWVSREDIPTQVVAEKRAALTELARNTGKPPAIVEKMVEGRMRKFYEEVVLGMQPFVLNPDQQVELALTEAEEREGARIVVKAFVRFQTGDGIEKRP